MRSLRSALLVALAASACGGCPRAGAPADARPADPGIAGLAPGRVAPVPPGQAVAADHGLPLERVRLPPGFRIAPYATGVKNARSLALSPRGTLFVGTRTEGKVYAIPNADGDARGDRVITVASGLDSPNGVVFHEGALYVAEVSRILRFDALEDRLESPPAPVVVTDTYPDKAHHGWKFLALGPDGNLYVPVGAPCNVCDEADPIFASLTRIGLDGQGREIVAKGVRNTVGFTWHPVTKELWFTDNGRDGLGDDAPGDELNRLSREGEHFGFPFCHAGTIADEDHGAKMRCADTTPPVQVLGPHVAALGLRFYTGRMFPADYTNQILIAEHGSWNRSAKIGYRLTRVRLEGNVAKAYEVFADGFLDAAKDEAWGRPVDVLVAPDGALLVSDDEAGAIYRIDHVPPAP